MTAHRWLQIEMAAKGCVSGTLREWPHLLAALRELGEDAHGWDRSCAWVPRCRELIAARDENSPCQARQDALL